MTLKALKLVREVCKVNTVLGVSNISFGTSETSCDQCAFLYDGDAARAYIGNHQSVLRGDDEFLLCVLCADEL